MLHASPEIQFHLATIYSDIDLPEKAVECLRKLLARDKKNLKAQMQIAQIWEKDDRDLTQSYKAYMQVL